MFCRFPVETDQKVKELFHKHDFVVEFLKNARLWIITIGCVNRHFNEFRLSVQYMKNDYNFYLDLNFDLIGKADAD